MPIQSSSKKLLRDNEEHKRLKSSVDPKWQEDRITKELARQGKQKTYRMKKPNLFRIEFMNFFTSIHFSYLSSFLIFVY